MSADKRIMEAPLSKVVEIAREYPSVQSNIGWAVLTRANFADIPNLRELFDYIERYEEEQRD